MFKSYGLRVEGVGFQFWLRLWSLRVQGSGAKDLGG